MYKSDKWWHNVVLYDGFAVRRSDGLGTKLLQNLLVLHQMLRNLLLEAIRENSPWWGCEGSLLRFSARDKQHFCAMSCTEGKEDLMIFSAVLAALLTSYESEAPQPPNHTEKQFVSMLLENAVKMGGGRWAPLILCRKKHALLCPLDQWHSFHRPGEFVCDLRPQELGAFDHLHNRVVIEKWGVARPILPKVKKDLFYLVHIQNQPVIPAPAHQLLQLSTVYRPGHCCPWWDPVLGDAVTCHQSEQ